jgi:hypothetical protein
MLIIALFILGLVSRLTPHLPNFTPIIAISLFSGAYLNKKYALWLPLTLYIISDVIIGLSGTILFTWGSIFLITLLGQKILRSRVNLKNNLIFTLFSAGLFFVLTNFGVWLIGWYSPDFSGLIQSYAAGVPFFRVSLLANLLYISVLASVYDLVLKKSVDKKTVFALLLN